MMTQFIKSYQLFKVKLIDWLSRQFPRFFYRYLYGQHLFEQHRYFDVAEFFTRGDPLESERIYVPLHLNPKSVHEITTALIQDELEHYDDVIGSRRQEIWHFLSTKELAAQNLAVVAGPGFGKSTLMRHMTLTIMSNKKKIKSLGLSYRIPILLFLREHAVFVRSKVANIASLVAESIPAQLYSQLRQTLITCGPFATNQELESIFVDARINPWINQIPEAQNKENRVEGLINLLHNQYHSNTGENALVLFLKALLDRANPNTACSTALSDLISDLSVELVQQQQAIAPDATFNSDYSLIAAIEREMTKYKGPSIPTNWFENQLQKGNCLIMFDGLDEIPNPLTRKQAAAWIEAQIIAYPQNRFILSSRPTSYQHAQFNRFTVLEVMSFNLQQIEEFAYNWYLAHRARGIGEVNSAIEKEAKEKAAHFLNNVLKNERLYKLATGALVKYDIKVKGIITLSLMPVETVQYPGNHADLARRGRTVGSHFARK